MRCGRKKLYKNRFLFWIWIASSVTRKVYLPISVSPFLFFSCTVYQVWCVEFKDSSSSKRTFTQEKKTTLGALFYWHMSIVLVNLLFRNNFPNRNVYIILTNIYGVLCRFFFLLWGCCLHNWESYEFWMTTKFQFVCCFENVELENVCLWFLPIATLLLGNAFSSQSGLHIHDVLGAGPICAKLKWRFSAHKVATH